MRPEEGRSVPDPAEADRSDVRLAAVVEQRVRLERQLRVLGVAARGVELGPLELDPEAERVDRAGRHGLLDRRRAEAVALDERRGVVEPEGEALPEPLVREVAAAE